jgi:hypothetical protein
VILDAIVLRCLPTGILRFEQFETTPHKGCRMNARCAAGVPIAYMRRMLRTVSCTNLWGAGVSYRTDLSPHAKALAQRVINPILPTGRCDGSERPLCIAGGSAIIR